MQNLFLSSISAGEEGPQGFWHDSCNFITSRLQWHEDWRSRVWREAIKVIAYVRPMSHLISVWDVSGFKEFLNQRARCYTAHGRSVHAEAHLVAFAVLDCKKGREEVIAPRKKLIQRHSQSSDAGQDYKIEGKESLPYPFWNSLNNAGKVFFFARSPLAPSTTMFKESSDICFEVWVSSSSQKEPRLSCPMTETLMTLQHIRRIEMEELIPSSKF